MLLFIILTQNVFGQCTLTIASFPYNESFETGAGSWVSGGVSDDWAWGTPSKPVISSAGGGLKCWITGGLTTSFYNYGERSWVQSPCFDFSSLSHPYISFKVFWETEFQFDGANLQFSLNNGTSWTNVGFANDPVNCNNANWFNYSPVTYLTTLATVRDGWTGSGAVNGSNGWLLAEHCMQYLAGEPSVIFRFTFGAGTILNNFDGFAFDDITIREADAVAPGFTWSCVSTNSISFSDQSLNCPDQWTWDFGDPASGSNAASTQNTTHVFSGPGTYTVTLNAGNGCSASGSTTQVVNILQANAVAVNASCYGSADGSATIQVAGGGAPFNYTWATTPPQFTATAGGLTQGSYVYTVTGNNARPDTNSIIVTEPPQLIYSVSTVPANCGLNNGSASATVSGGTWPYTYAWSNGGGNVSTISNLPAGNNYSLTITDAHNCSAQYNFSVGQLSALTVTSNIQGATCGLSNGSISLFPAGGAAPYSYAWQPGVSSGSAANGLGGGNYIINITDSLGCNHQETILVSQQPAVILSGFSFPDTCSNGNGIAGVQVLSGVIPFQYSWNITGATGPVVMNVGEGNFLATITDSNGCSSSLSVAVHSIGNFQISLGDDQVICSGNEIKLSAGQFNAYEWQDGSSEKELIISRPGTYWLQATNGYGCTASDTLLVEEDCLHDVLAPKAFTPNGDGINDQFRAIGLNVSSFAMRIFTRWGEKIFESSVLEAGWDGTLKGQMLPSDLYVWEITFSVDNEVSRTKEGHVLLLR